MRTLFLIGFCSLLLARPSAAQQALPLPVPLPGADAGGGRLFDGSSPRSEAVAVPLSEGPLRYNEIFTKATHNSYWVKRSLWPDIGAHGTQERLLDQLLFEHARGLELDVHKSEEPGTWDVYHTNRNANVLCSPLSECLKQLRQFQYALPKHEVVTVVIELKEHLGRNFDDFHTPRDFDRQLEEALGPYLYRPKDQLARCAPGSALRDCVKRQGWPAVQDLRGKFIFTVMGLWKLGPIGHAAADWAEYATWNGDELGGIGSRSAWPMASDLPRGRIPEPKLSQALSASAFLQVERLSDPANLANVAKLLADGIVVQVSDAPGPEAQRDHAAWGAQLAQTNLPWTAWQDGGPKRPFTPRRPGADPAQLEEPGQRIEFRLTGKAGAEDFHFMENHDALADWETLPSSTRPSQDPEHPNPRAPGGEGCLRAEGPKGALSICRSVPLQSGPKNQAAVVTVELEKDGRSSTRSWTSGAQASTGIGDQLRLKVERRPDGSACASAFSASEIGFGGAPSWTLLHHACFDGGLPRQGLAARRGDVLFFRSLLNGRPVDPASLAPSPGSSGYSVRDLSVAP